MANIVGPEEAVAGLFLDWSSLILVLFILGIGYIGLVFVQHLRKKKVYGMPLYDKIIRSALLGFVSFSIILSMSGVNLTNREDIFILISKSGLGLFITTVLVCVSVSYTVYIIFYGLPNVEIVIERKKKPRIRKKA